MLGPRLRLTGSPTPTASGRVPSALRHAPAVLLLAVGLWRFPLAVMTPTLAYLPGDLVDSRLNNYVLEHGYRWATGREPAFWAAPFCWPVRDTTARSDAHLGELPVYSLFRAAGAFPERAYQFTLLTFFAANYAAAVWAARRFGIGHVGAAAAGYLFAFGLPTAEHLVHGQMVPRCLVPPAFYFFWRVVWEPSWRRLLGLAACVVGQLYLTMYLGILLAGLLAAAGLALAAWNRGRLPWAAWLRPGWPEFSRRIAVVVLAAGAAAPLLIPHAKTAATATLLPREALIETIPDVGGWLRPTAASAAWAWLRPHVSALDPADGFYGGKRLFPGLLPCLAVFGGIALVLTRPRGGPGRAGLLAVLVLTAVAVPAVVVRHDLWSPYEAGLSLPLVGSIRAVGRIGLLWLLPLGLLVGLLIDAVASRVTRRFGLVAGTFASLAVAAAVVTDQRFVGAGDAFWGERRCAVADAVGRREALAEVIREECGTRPAVAGRPRVVAVFPRDAGWDLETQLDAMWAAQQCGLPTVNGWTGLLPRDWFPPGNHSELQRWLWANGASLEFLHPGVIVVGRPRGLDGDPTEERLRTLAGFRARPGT